MESTSDSLLLNYADNDELKALLGGKEPGDEVTLTIKCTVRANDDDGFDATIDDVSIASADEDEGEDTEEVDEDEADTSIVAMSSKDAEDE